MPSTCTLVGTLTDSSGVAIGGTLKVVLDAPIFDDSTNPDRIILDVPKTFTIPTTGVINIPLPVSEVARTSYLFELIPTGGAAKQFRAVVPDQATVEFASLMPTSYTTDRAATGALRIAKEMLTNAAILPYLVNGLGFITQDANPGEPDSPTQIWLRPSNGFIHTWDIDKSQWKSPIQVVTVGKLDLSASTVVSAPVPDLAGYGTGVVERVRLKWAVQSGFNDGFNRWTMRPGFRVSYTPTIQYAATSYPSNPSGYIVGGQGQYEWTVGTYFSAGVEDFAVLEIGREGNPGLLNASAAFFLRYLAN